MGVSCLPCLSSQNGCSFRSHPLNIKYYPQLVTSEESEARKAKKRVLKQEKKLKAKPAKTTTRSAGPSMAGPVTTVPLVKKRKFEGEQAPSISAGGTQLESAVGEIHIGLDSLAPLIDAYQNPTRTMMGLSSTISGLRVTMSKEEGFLNTFSLLVEERRQMMAMMEAELKRERRKLVGESSGGEDAGSESEDEQSGGGDLGDEAGDSDN